MLTEKDTLHYSDEFERINKRAQEIDACVKSGECSTAELNKNMAELRSLAVKAQKLRKIVNRNSR